MIRTTRPGQLFYLMGASGSGKDSLMQAARAQLASDDRTLFAHRYITRPADSGGENHIALDKTDFAQRADTGFFLFHWQAHSNRYGIGIEVEHWLDAGFNVVMNGSRAYLPEASARLPNLISVSVDVTETTLAKRLETRGREATTDVAQRLARTRILQAERAPKLTPDAIIDNNGALDTAVQALLRLIRSTAAH